MLIKLVNKTKQTLRTQLFKMGKKEVIEVAILPKAETVYFYEELLTEVANDQIRKKYLVKVEAVAKV